MSPIHDMQTEEPSQPPALAETSAAPTPTATQRTYMPVQNYQWWLITKEYFSDLEERVGKMYMYEREMLELSRLIPRNNFPRASWKWIRLDCGQRSKKIGRSMSSYTQRRSGYIKPATKYDKSLWDNQPAWWEKWMNKRRDTLQIYYDSPQEMRIDPKDTRATKLLGNQ